MPEPIKRMFRPGAALNIVLGLLALASITLGVVWSGIPVVRGGRALELTDGELAGVLTRLSLDAAPLAAAGLATQQVQAVVSNARSFLTNHVQDVRDADQDWADARKEVDRLEGLIRAGAGTQQDVSALATARTTLASAASIRQSTLDAVFSAATDGLAVGKVATVNAIKAARAAGWDAPTQYLTVARDEADWVELRGALANQRVAAKHGEQPSNAATQVLNAANSHNTVAAAATNLNNSLTTTTTTWNANVFP